MIMNPSFLHKNKKEKREERKKQPFPETCKKWFILIFEHMINFWHTKQYWSDFSITSEAACE